MYFIASPFWDRVTHETNGSRRIRHRRARALDYLRSRDLVIGACSEERSGMHRLSVFNNVSVDGYFCDAAGI